MSIEAIAYVKGLGVENPTSRLLLFVIAENTFNDTGLCKVGQKVLVDETRSSERTIRRHLADLMEETIVRVHTQPKAGGGRLVNAIEIVGFPEWLEKARGIKPAKMAALPEPAKMAASNRPPLAGSNRSLLAGSYKESRTKSRTKSARARDSLGAAVASRFASAADLVGFVEEQARNLAGARDLPSLDEHWYVVKGAQQDLGEDHYKRLQHVAHERWKVLEKARSDAKDRKLSDITRRILGEGV